MRIVNKLYKKSKEFLRFEIQLFILFFFQRMNKTSHRTSSKRPPASPIKSTNISDDNLHWERNTLVVLGCLAEKLG